MGFGYFPHQGDRVIIAALDTCTAAEHDKLWCHNQSQNLFTPGLAEDEILPCQVQDFYSQA